MNHQSYFGRTYEGMSDGQLLQIANEGGLVDEAKGPLAEELRRRNLKPSDLPRHKESQRTRLRREASERTITSRGGPTGLAFFGRHYLTPADKEANIQLRTKWIAFSGLPLVPLASYRFKCKQHGWRFWHWTDQVVIDRVRLNWDQVFLTWLKASPFYLVILILLLGWVRFRHH
jgi:hypothetical protein